MIPPITRLLNYLERSKGISITRRPEPAGDQDWGGVRGAEVNLRLQIVYNIYR